MAIDVEGLLFDDVNEAKFAGHEVLVAEVQEVYDNEPRFYRNGPDRRGSHVMLGPTDSGKLLAVPIEDIGDGIWRPVTAFIPRPQQAERFRRST